LKLFEKVIADQIRANLDANKLLIDGQNGFRLGHSCETALQDIISKCLNNLDNQINLLLLIDFKKAFDFVNPEIL
jgi:hypothetical protein